LVFGLLTPVDEQRVAEALLGAHYDLVTLVHVETNTGVVNPVESIGRLILPSDTLFFVDGACSIGAMPFPTDAWGVDISTTGSHKCLCSIPGLAVISVSKKAWARLPSPGFMGSYFDLETWWRSTNERKDLPPFTQPTTLVFALHEALRQIEQIGVEAWWSVHREVADRFIREMRAAGFHMLLDNGPAADDRESYSDTVVALEYPPNVSDQACRDLLMNEFGIFVIGNIGEFSNRSFRVGLMSPPQLEAVNLDSALAAFSVALKSPVVRLPR
jgi:alanine-glyoxylate transaminase/serine-glyoxylate transaminase/serine-pyruvate transaminase